VQFFFIGTDLFFLWKKNGSRSLNEIWTYERHTLETIVFFWLLYFALQVIGVALIPTMDQMTTNLHSWLNLSPSHLEVSPSVFFELTLLHVWTYLVVSFWDYVTHRWILHHPWFWIFHEYHHLPKQVFNGMPGISVRPYVFVTTALTYLGVLFFLWLPLRWMVTPDVASLFIQSLPIQSLILTLVLSLVHSHWLRTFPAIHRVLKRLGITTPHEHTLHHSERLIGNYGNFSCIWDHLFKSYIDPTHYNLEQEPLGLSYDQDFLGALCRGTIKMPGGWRSKSQIKNFCRIS
jgi:sterol desaturase/sphingolipid hydroxylase (fatty acid hydroxylase superfamily)